METFMGKALRDETVVRCVSVHVKAPISFLLRHLLKRLHAMFGLGTARKMFDFRSGLIPGWILGINL